MSKTYYLIGHAGEPHIAQPGCTLDYRKTRAEEDEKLTLCWVDRNGVVICFSGEEDFVLKSPYDK